MTQQTTIARIVKSNTTYSSREATEIAARILFLLRHPGANPLRTERFALLDIEKR